MKAADVMTRRIISVSPERTILEAIKLMLRHHISGLPVIGRKGKLVGIVTESDFLHRPEIGTERKRSSWLDALFGPAAAAHDYVRSRGLQVQDVMTRDPVTVAENALARRGRPYDGSPWCQTLASHAARQACGHRQPRRPDACGREHQPRSPGLRRR